mmetsp:Transcript_21799/g.31829  ORF Transcript_21799/g.31829 Transcript_21799/m.31829 type:complete len:123 (+) Transcript_21799:443-811(+)
MQTTRVFILASHVVTHLAMVLDEKVMVVGSDQWSSRDTIEAPPCKLPGETCKLALLGEIAWKDLTREAFLVGNYECLTAREPPNDVTVVLIRHNVMQFEGKEDALIFSLGAGRQGHAFGAFT